MHFLKQPVGRITCVSDYSSTYDKLLGKLKEMNFGVESQNKNKGQILILCLSILFNMILWKCWGDKLLFEVKCIEENRTTIDIFAIPNLFRTRAKKAEKPADLDKLLYQLKTYFNKG